MMQANNPGIAALSEDILIADLIAFDVIEVFVKKHGIDFAFIGPEAPLEAGIVDFLENLGVRAVGPKKELAKLEIE